MRIKRKAAAGLCMLMLAQTCIPTGAAQSQTVSVKESAKKESEAASQEEDSETTARATEEETDTEDKTGKETTAKEPTVKETTAKETTDEETTAQETTDGETETRKAGSDGKSAARAVHQKLTLDQETGKAELEIELKGAEKGNVLNVDIPDGYEVKLVSRIIDGGEEQVLSAEEGWQVEGQQLTCQIDSAAARASKITYGISCSFTDAQWEAYAKSKEGLECQVMSQARLCDSDGVVLEETASAEKKLELKPFLEKEAEGQGRDERTFLWTDWLNLGMGAGEGYLVAVIEDLEDGQHFDFEENQVVLVDSDGEEIAQIPVTEAAPEQTKAFGEIFTVEDARLLAGGADGAVFYTYEDDEEKQNGILLVPVDSLKERTGVVYRTRVSASEQPDVYQWDVTLRSGSKFLWNQTGDEDEWTQEAGLRAEAGQKEQVKEKAEEETEADENAKAEEEIEAEKKAKTEKEAGTGEKETDDTATPIWELRGERISSAELAEVPEKTDVSSESVWLETSGSCSLVAQTAEADGYDRENGTAVWDFFVNQNGENLQEAVITRELPGDEQSFTGDLADGKPLEAILYEGEDWESDSGKKVEIPAFEEEKFQETAKEESGFFGYYVLEQDESGKSDSSLEIHLFQLGQAACGFQVETEVKDTVFAECREDFSISSGKTEYTAVLEKQGDEAGESRQTQGNCEAELPWENNWITLEAVGAGEDSCYDYENHSITWEMTVNPDQHSLLEPKVTVTLPDGLEQVKLEQAVFIDEKGKKQDISKDEWIQVEETAPNKRKKERKAVFSWQAPEDEEEALSPKGTYQLTFTCQVSDDMRQESFRGQEPKEFALSCKLEGQSGTEEESRKIQGAEGVFSCIWDGAAAWGTGSYQEDLYKQEGSVWDGTRMPRADWCAVVNRNGADFTDMAVRLAWPEGMALEKDSIQINTTKLNADGTEADIRERKLQSEYADEIQVTDSYLEITISEELGKETLAITFSSFAISDMEEADFKGTYQLMQKEKVLEAGEFAVEGAKAVSVAEAAKQNQIPAAMITVSSANSDPKLPYHLSGAGYRLVKLTADGDGDSWEDYGETAEEAAEENKKAMQESEEESEETTEESEETTEEAAEDSQKETAEESNAPVIIEGTAASDGTTVFLFLEQDTLYRLEELEAVPGYEPWENSKYVAVLDQKNRSDFPKADDDHELITGKEQVLIKDSRTPVQWENHGEACEGGQITFFVQDQDGQPLEDAACSLTYVDYVNPGSRGLRSKTVSSDEDGLVVFDGLDAVTENQEGYEIHVTAPSGLEDPAEFSASVAYQEDGTFEASLNGKAVEQKKDGAYVTCLPVTADVKIPVTDQNGNLLKGCGLTLEVEVLADESDETEEDLSYDSYESCPEVSEDGSGYIRITDLPYGTYRLSGSTAVLTLVIDDSGVEAVLEDVEQVSIKLDLTADDRGVYGAAEEDGWYLEEMIPRASAALTLTDAANSEISIEGGRFLIYETWSNRLVGELKEEEQPEEEQPEDEQPEEKELEDERSEEKEPEDEQSEEKQSEDEQPEEEQTNTPGLYRLAPSDRKDAAEENDRGYAYLEEIDGVYHLLPGTYAIWQVESAEGYEPEGDGIWYFTIGRDSDEIGNDDLMAGDGNWKLFENSVIQVPVPVSTIWQSSGLKGEEQESTVALLLKGTSWNAETGDLEYEQKIICPAGGNAVFEQVPVGIYVISVSDEQAAGKAQKAKKSKSKALKGTGKIQVQVQYDGQVIFRTISGRDLDQAKLVLKEE